MRYAFRHPLQAFRYWRAPHTLVRKLQLQLSPHELKGYLGEAAPLTRSLETKLADVKWPAGSTPGASTSQDRGPVLYALVRALRPTHVLETGVASGTSSYYLLAALAKNGSGSLDSVDLPPEAWKGTAYGERDTVALPEQQRTGWVVPVELRPRWRLHLGDTKALLPGIVAGASPVDLFLHDSEHTYETMIFEYRTVWPFLRESGVLASDDVGWNRAFGDFAREHRLNPCFVGGLGFAVKPPAPKGAGSR
jgi:predicted O-methyltransferase YrrM